MLKQFILKHNSYVHLLLLDSHNTNLSNISDQVSLHMLINQIQLVRNFISKSL